MQQQVGNVYGQKANDETAVATKKITTELT